MSYLFNADPEPKATHLRIFPTNILMIDHMGLNLKPMIEWILNNKKQGTFQINKLYEHKEFDDLVEKIRICSINFCNQMKYQAHTVDITDVWANVLEPGDMHPPHTHSNNILSGVFYLTGGPNIIFQDPRSGASVIDPVAERIIDNATVVEYEALPNRMMIFPAWLPHWVPINKMNGNRISISWNVMLQGKIGQDKQSSTWHDFNDSFK